MIRSIPSRIGMVLSLALGTAVLAQALVPEVAHAQAPADKKKDATRDQREERRVMKATQVDIAGQKSAEFRELARKARLESMQRLKGIIQNFEGSAEQRADMIMRLAELEFEEGRDLYLSEMETYNTAVDKCFNQQNPPCAIDSVKVDEYTKQSRKWQETSIKHYRQILQSYPTFQRADEATFFLGQALADIGQKKEANDEFTRLVKTYPRSGKLPDAYVLIGEYWFELNEATKALTHYLKATQYKDHDKYAFANYKLAWCYFNVGETAKSIDTMKAVVQISMADNTGKKSNLQLQEEALKDLVRFFADAGEMEEAYRYFTGLGKKDLISDMLKRLAGTYIEQGKFELAINTYKRLISEAPNGANAPEYQNEIIKALQKMGKKADTLAAIEELRKTYGKGSLWARENAANQEAVKSAGDYLEKNLRTVANDYHAEARKLKTGEGARQAYDYARKAYENYLEYAVGNPASYDVRHDYAELLYTVKDYGAAYEQYMEVVKLQPKGKHSRFCARSAIFAAEEVIKKQSKEAGGGSPDPGKGNAAVELNDWEKKQLAAMDQFRSLFPDDKDTRGVLYKSAYLLFSKNQFKEASDRFRIVIGMDPASDDAERAANLILSSFEAVEDWTNLKDVSKAFRDQKGLGNAKFKTEIGTIYEKASLKLIEVNLAKDKDEAKAATGYVEFYKEFPTSESADFALNNATVYLRKLGRVAETITWRKEIYTKFPKSKFFKEQVAQLGFDYESIADFAQAAEWYERLFSLDTQYKAADAAIYRAAEFRKALGQWEQSIKDYELYIKTYPDKPDLTGLQFQIAKTLEDQGRSSEASKFYNGFFTKPPATASMDEVIFARLRYGLLLDKLGQGSKVAQHWKETNQVYEKAKGAGTQMSAVAPTAIAQIRFMLAESEYQRFMAMKIDGPGDKKGVRQKDIDVMMKTQLANKLKAIGALEKTYTAVVSEGAGEWGLAALVRLGGAYENMSATLKASYIPNYLTPDQKELYVMALEDKAYPAVEKAANFYGLALQKAYEFNLYNDNTGTATRRLGVIRPDDFPGLFEDVPKPRFAAPSVTTAPFVTEP